MRTDLNSLVRSWMEDTAISTVERDFCDFSFPSPGPNSICDRGARGRYRRLGRRTRFAKVMVACGNGDHAAEGEEEEEEEGIGGSNWRGIENWCGRRSV